MRRGHIMLGHFTSVHWIRASCMVDCTSFLNNKVDYCNRDESVCLFPGLMEHASFFKKFYIQGVRDLRWKSIPTARRNTIFRRKAELTHCT